MPLYWLDTETGQTWHKENGEWIKDDTPTIRVRSLRGLESSLRSAPADESYSSGGLIPGKISGGEIRGAEEDTPALTKTERALFFLTGFTLGVVGSSIVLALIWQWLRRNYG